MRIALQIVVAVAAVTALMTPALAAQSAGDSAHEPVQSLNESADGPPDPDGDPLGWENGYWYNESVPVEDSQDLNRTEVDALVARSMARVERLRGLEFEETPQVRFASLAEHRAFVNRTFESRNSFHQNTVYEAMFIVGEDQAVSDTRQEFSGGFAAARYLPEDRGNFSAGTIMFVTPGANQTRLSEPVLGHELVHALQDQHFGIDRRRGTEDQTRVHRSVFEGDATYVDRAYRRQCGDTWECLPGSRLGAGTSLGGKLVLYNSFPYSSGRPFVDAVREESGLDGVNALYEDNPASTEQIIHPERYGSDEPTDVTVQDRSSDEWVVPDAAVGPERETIGELGVFMLFNRGSGTTTYYTDPASAGWDGDELVPYVRSESPSTDETGYVWKITWDSPEDATEFAEEYRDHLDNLDAQAANAANVYLIEEGPYADAFALRVDGDTTTVVNAPSLETLDEIRVDTVPEETGTQGTTTATPSGAEESTETPTADGDGDGFGPIVALVALVGTVLLARRVR